MNREPEIARNNADRCVFRCVFLPMCVDRLSVFIKMLYHLYHRWRV